jgi:hypothetical protein
VLYGPGEVSGEWDAGCVGVERQADGCVVHGMKRPTSEAFDGYRRRILASFAPSQPFRVRIGSRAIVDLQPFSRKW